MPFLFDSVYKQLSPFVNARRWLVAYSGGVDSHVLLHLLVRIVARNPGYPPVEVVHVNHQLQDGSDQWASHCQQQADALSVPLTIVPVEINRDTSGSLEEKARQARYTVFESLIEPGDLLLLGHHLDDQVETLMLRLLRGSGSRGASAMPRSRAIGYGRLLRPLLDLPRTAIECYAQDNQLQWVQDPSNNSSDFDRNFLRLQLLPILAQRWPEYRQTLSRAAALSEESANLNEELAELDFHSLSLSPESKSIPLSALSELSVARQKNIVRYWLQVRHLPLPSVAQLQTVLDEVIGARQDAEPLVAWPGVQIRRFKQELYAMAPLAYFDNTASYGWDLSQPLSIPGAGLLSVKSTMGAGIAISALARNKISVQFRQGGERCRPAGRSGSQSLKKLLQEYEVEPWLRDRLPLVYCEDKLIMVADLWVCEGFQVAADEEGLMPVWVAS